MTTPESMDAATEAAEAITREIRPRLIAAATRDLCQVDRFHVTEAIDDWLTRGPATVRSALDACVSGYRELMLAGEEES